MLDIVLFVLTSPPVDLLISPSTNQVKSMAMSNSDGFTPNHLLQQMYGTNVVDEDVNVELGDEDLELIAGMPRTNGSGRSYESDIIVGNRVIVNYPSFLQYMKGHDDHQQINYIRNQFQASGIPVGNEQVYGVIWNNLRNLTPVMIKRSHRGFTVDLNTGQLSYNQ